MRAVVQRVTRASVMVDGKVVGAIDGGFLILLGITHADGETEVLYLARKIAGLRVFEDEAGKMNLALEDVGGAALVVSQFTLYGDMRKGRRPSFTNAAAPGHAEALYQRFCALLTAEGVQVAQGVFQAHMEVALDTDPKRIWANNNLLDAPVELNHASRAELLYVPGIGPKAADAIIQARQRGQLRELAHLSALGIRDIARTAPYILLDGKRPAQQLTLF